MHQDDASESFSRLFGSSYSDMPRLPRDVVVGGVYGRYEGLSFRRMFYSGDFSLPLPDGPDEITFVIPTAGKVLYDHIAQTLGLPQIGIAVEKIGMRSVSYQDDHAECGMSIMRPLLTERLSLLLGRPITHRLSFEPSVNVNTPAFIGLKALLEFATGREFEGLLNAGAFMPARLQEMLSDAVLQAWPHTYSDALHSPAPTVAPRYVKRAMEYIQEYPDGIVSGAELAQMTNISLRALQDGFQRFAGTSIVAYQRQVRLERANSMLSRGDVASVTEVAVRCGFSNVSRFSSYFQTAYGVSPLELLKRRGFPEVV